MQRKPTSSTAYNISHDKELSIQTPGCWRPQWPQSQHRGVVTPWQRTYFGTSQEKSVFSVLANSPGHCWPGKPRGPPGPMWGSWRRWHGSPRCSVASDGGSVSLSIPEERKSHYRPIDTVSGKDSSYSGSKHSNCTLILTSDLGCQTCKCSWDTQLMPETNTMFWEKKNKQKKHTSNTQCLSAGEAAVK